MTQRRYRIGIDMRMAGEGFGIGKYCTELARALISQKQFDYVLFFDRSFSQSAYENFKKLNVECHLLNAKYYSVEEQVKLPFQLARLNLDLVHFTNFNVPILYPGKFVVTIHDLIHHRFPGTSTRTIIWRWGYKFVIKVAVKRAEKVIAVSESSRRDIISMLGVPGIKVSVAREAVDKNFVDVGKDVLTSVLKKFSITKPYIIWVGVWRRYKNLETLVRAFNKLLERGHDLQLVLAGEEDKHHPEVAVAVKELISKERLVAPGRVSGLELAALYQGAKVFVNPSLSEGFGLTSVEAQAFGLPVVASDIPVMREVLSDSALYFNKTSPEQLTERLNIILTDKILSEEYKAKSLQNVKRYTWDETGKKTEHVFKSVLNG